MSAENVFRNLSRETKALIVVSEFEARRLTIDQMREVFEALSVNEDEKRQVLTLVENDLRATGYHPNAVAGFIRGLLTEAPTPAEAGLLQTRRLRSPFALGFENASQAPAGGPAAPQTVAAAAAPPAPEAAPTVATPAAPAAAPAPATVAASAPPAPPPRMRTVVFATAPAGLTTAPPLPQVATLALAQGQRVATSVVPPSVPRPKVLLADGPPAPSEVPPSGPPSRAGTRAQALFGTGVKSITAAAVDRPRVLLADDDMRIRIVFRLCLERMGLTVVEAVDGNEAWKRVQEGSWALVILDMKMPGLHGLEVISRMLDRQMETPVIICSAYDQLKDEFVIATHPRLRYLVKPVSAEALDKATRELLGNLVKPPEK